jgi:hypothetical protein
MYNIRLEQDVSVRAENSTTVFTTDVGAKAAMFISFNGSKVRDYSIFRTNRNAHDNENKRRAV